jgi:hypothetical protein
MNVTLDLPTHFVGTAFQPNGHTFSGLFPNVIGSNNLRIALHEQMSTFSKPSMTQFSSTFSMI